MVIIVIEEKVNVIKVDNVKVDLVRVNVKGGEGKWRGSDFFFYRVVS